MRLKITTAIIAAMTVAAGGQYAFAGQMTELIDSTVISVDGVTVDRPVIEHTGEFLKVGMDLDLSGLDVRSNRAVLLTPHLVSETDSLELPSIGIYGRQRYFFYVRNGKSMITEDEESYRTKDMPESVDYSRVVAYPEWAKGNPLKLHLRWSEYGCCGNLLDQLDGLLFTEAVAFYPALIYPTPEGQAEKIRSLSGSARVEFVVDKTDIRPDYRNNVPELRKITATIDSVRNDSDVTITRIFLKGYASPESPYSHNTDLAKGRTAAVKEYVRQLYSFPDSIFVTDYEPEDWEGLREYVLETPALSHKSEILGLIDGDLEPDAKEAKIRYTYPEDYAYLLKNCYPALRHTYYEVSYVVKTYTIIEEIKAVYASQPGKLSLNEFFLLSKEYEPGTEEFLDVFETAVMLYPTDEATNVNAANAALRRFDTKRAEKYLDRAGESAEAEYARGVCAYWESDYDAAVEHFRKALDGGIEQAAEVLENLENSDRDHIEAARKAAIMDVLNVD